MNAAPTLPSGTLLAGKFRIVRLLGAGAMGAVYAVDHELTRHRRALKLLHPDVRMVPDLVRRFLNEASAAGRAGDPHLVETFDAGILPTGEPYVVMELLEGETLNALLARERALDQARAAEIVAQAAEGIHAAHRAGIIHRDIKPDNLFLTKREGRVFVKILDFGVAKFRATSIDPTGGTQAGMMYGSPAYMSPEQLKGQLDIDARTDVFALGVVLYQCLSGGLPFDAPNVHALTVRVLSGEPTPIETLRTGLPPGLVQVVRGALAPERERRIASARELATSLNEWRPARGGLTSAFATAATVLSGVSGALSGSWPQGVPRPRSGLALFAALVATLLTVLAALALFGRHALLGALATSRPAPSPVLVSTPPPVESSAPSLPRPAATLPPEPPAHAAPKVGPAPAAPAAASSRPSAQSLGLSKENPFR
jgi:serine/threonine-protein kinase